MIAVYKIVNKITGDYYIGSSKDVKRRWKEHRCQSMWRHHPNKQLYIDMQKYGRDKFIMEVIEEVMIEELHSREQYWIEQLQPVYNMVAAYTGLDKKQYMKQYRSQHADEIKQRMKQYNSQHADEIKQYMKQYRKQYHSQQCNYNGKMLTLHALEMRFRKQGIKHPTAEAKKYLIS